MPENRGNIMQWVSSVIFLKQVTTDPACVQCTNWCCNHTIFHMDAYPQFDDTLRMAVHANFYSPCLQLPVPPLQLPVPPLQLPVPSNLLLIPPPFAQPIPPQLPVTSHQPMSSIGEYCAGPKCIPGKPGKKPHQCAANYLFKRCAGCCDMEFQSAQVCCHLASMMQCFA